MSRENIKVICRLRPENERELESGCKPCLVALSKETLRISQEVASSSEEGTYDFTYDRVFDANSRQIEIFEYSAKPIIKGALEGINGTLFCYGQTSSGKTHTMEGKYDDEEQRGIIPRMMEYIFNLIPSASSDLEFTVKCSYLQIYNEKIQDLLDTRKSNLIVKEEKSKGVWVDEATEIYVSSQEEMFEVFQVGSQNRTVAETAMNLHSSRSHSLFIVTLFQKNNITDSTKSGKLYFVDLAGSEKMSKTGIEGGQGLVEAKNINKSLLMLGMVINALTEGKTHVPYRDSKLTRVLQESLGGNSQTTLIITCSMSSFNYSESLSTLRFGQRAKMIKNKVVANTERSAKELLMKLQEAEEKIKNFENIILQLQNGEGMFDYKKTTSSVLQAQCPDCSNAMKKMLTQHIEMVTLQDELEDAKQDKAELEEEIQTRNKELYEINEKLLLCELNRKLLIEEEAKTFQELQMRLENVFLVNQTKLMHTDQVRAALEKMRYEMLLMLKGDQLQLKHNTKDDTSSVDHLTKFGSYLEESLDALKRIEEYIMHHNKQYNELIDFINLKDCNASDITGVSTSPMTCKSTQMINHIKNIHLNINSSININITPDDNRKRFNSENLISSNRKSRPHDKRKHKSFYFPPTNNPTDNDLPVNSDTCFTFREDAHADPDADKKYSSDCEDQVVKPIDFFEHSNRAGSVVKKQRKLIKDLLEENQNIKQDLTNAQEEVYQKELAFNKSYDSLQKAHSKIKDYEEIIHALNEKSIRKQEDFDAYKQKSLNDFIYKEKKLMELVNKVSDLEDENYKLIHFSKDTDKKKFSMMDKQIKQFTLELQKLISENANYKALLEKKEEETKSLTNKINDLEAKLAQSAQTKKISNADVSFADLQSSICTPDTKYLNPKGFTRISMTEFLTAKLKNYQSNKNLSSPIPEKERHTSDFSGISGSIPNEKENNRNSIGNNVNVNVNVTSFNGPDTSGNSSTNSPNSKIMRIIRGGSGGSGGSGSSKDQNFFFTKMLKSGTQKDEQDTINKVKSTKKNIDQFQKEKYEQELKLLEGDDLNYSGIENLPMRRVMTMTNKEQRGIMNIFKYG